MKKIVVLLLVLALTGCSPKGLTPIEITYEVQSLKVYQDSVDKSKVIRELSDFRLLELGIVDVPYCNLYDYVVTQGATSATYDNILNTATLSETTQINSNETTLIYNALMEGKNVMLENKRIIPALPEMQEQKPQITMPDVFIKSIIKEIGI